MFSHILPGSQEDAYKKKSCRISVFSISRNLILTSVVVLLSLAGSHVTPKPHVVLVAASRRRGAGSGCVVTERSCRSAAQLWRGCCPPQGEAGWGTFKGREVGQRHGLQLLLLVLLAIFLFTALRLPRSFSSPFPLPPARPGASRL